MTSTATPIRNIIKYQKSGPQISINARASWRSFEIPETEGDSLTIVNATNTGDRPTTITSWGMHWYPTGSSLDEKSTQNSMLLKATWQDKEKFRQKISLKTSGQE